MNTLQTLVHRQRAHLIHASGIGVEGSTAARVAEALALIPDCDGMRDCYFCAAADLARAQRQEQEH